MYLFKIFLFFTLFSSSLLSSTNFQNKYLNKEQIKFLKEHSVIRVSNERNWPPFDYYEDNEPKGYAIDYIKIIADKIGIKVVFETNSWKNLIEKAENKEIDIIHPLTISEDRKKYLYFTEPFIPNKKVIATRSENINIKSFEDLKGKVIAAGKNWSTTNFIKENYKDIKVLEVTSSKEMVKAVAFGEADAIIDNLLTINFLKKKYKLTNIEITNSIDNPSFTKKGLRIGVRKDWKVLGEILDIAIKNITQEEIDNLNSKYNDVKILKILLNKKEKEFLEKNKKIKIRVSKDYAPFSFIEKEQEKGYVIDFTNLIAKKIGLSIEYVKNQTWQEAIEDFKNGKLDVLPMIKMTEERKKFSSFTTSILETYVGIATLKEKSTEVTLESLKNKKVAVLDGYWFLDNLKKHYPEIETKIYRNNLEALIALKKKEVEAVISTEPVLAYLIKENYFIDLAVNPILNNPYFEKTLGRYAIRKDLEVLKDIFQKTIDSLTLDEINSLNFKWFGLTSSNKIKDSIDFSEDEQKYLEKNKVIKMCIDPNWYPYEKDKNGVHIGMTADYFKILQEYIPSKITYIPTKSWTQSLEYIKNRTCDILSLAAKTPSREKYLNFTTPYLNVPLVIATKLDKPFMTSFSNIKDKKFAVLKGYFYVEQLKETYPSINFLEVNSMKEGFNKVKEDEVYGFIDSLLTIGDKIQKEYFGSLKVVGTLDEKFSLGIAVRNDSDELLSIFEKTIGKIKDIDDKRIFNKWVSVKYEETINFKYLYEVLFVMFIFVSFFLFRQYILNKENIKLQLAQKKLEASLCEFESLINSTLEAILIFENEKCIKANKEAIKLLEYEMQEDLFEINISNIVNINELNKEANETIAYKKNKTTFPVLVKIEEFIFRDKKVKLMLIVDLTELKEKEKLLTESTKMAALGEMIGNIAHQWRQPLSVISTAASGVKIQKEMNILNDELFDKAVDGILLNAKYLSSTIDDFRNFILNKKQKISFDISSQVDSILSILEPMLKMNDIKLIKKCEENIRINSYPNELTQVIINIITNSKDKFLEEKIKERYIFLDILRKNNKVYIVIKDNGTGIKENVIKKIFEPYFTTKHQGQGTGLGLYMTREIIIKSLNGSIKAENVDFEYKDKKYKGAQFTIEIEHI